ncbi:threonine-phosphate decarboxylase CobD [Marinobacterium jannaschii]|uniref:threonine-phosphate decarboxylase CobD n=1 Tax=Marinobacterium jannaschii TaxID=64970 RepID=UPI0006866D36|nr:threonine-phosphate decarboxylase CobD [Marinobacterium jannaschii]
MSAPSESTSQLRPAHGGRLYQAARQYGIPQPAWTDLSTGVSPLGWPIPEIPGDIWQRLPEDDDGLVSAAQSYYGCSNLLPLAGSQQAIELLPRILPRGTVAIPDPGYQEHRYHWQQAGHQLHLYDSRTADPQLVDADYLLVINPNNPSGQAYSRDWLTGLLQKQQMRGGYLIIDEAFIDPTPEQSLCNLSNQPGLIILRSLGKFFGLAGIRVGFLIADDLIREHISRQISPWHISTPSRYIATLALQDTGWQQRAQQWQKAQSERLRSLLESHKLATRGTALFQSCYSPQAVQIHQQLARQAILTRLLDDHSALRFGLPANSHQLQQLADALEGLRL